MTDRDLVVSSDSFDDEVPTEPRAVLPVTYARAPWWRRLLGWFTGGDAIQAYCSRCGERVDLTSTDVCVGCQIRRAISGWSAQADFGVTTDQATMALEQLSAEISDSDRRTYVS